MNALETFRTHLSTLVSPGSWKTLGQYVGFRRQKRKTTLESADDLAEFISTRASHVAQTTLYGYLRTRAGTRFPELFDNPDIVISINIAKWQIWLACISDLSIFIGQVLHQSGQASPSEIGALMSSMLDRILRETEIPSEAGPDIEATLAKERLRISSCDWSIDRDDDTIFSQSPTALYYWSPIADELKDRDEIIVRNSIRFSWIEIRRNLRKQLDIESIFQSESSSRQSAQVNAI